MNSKQKLIVTALDVFINMVNLFSCTAIMVYWKIDPWIAALLYIVINILGALFVVTLADARSENIFNRRLMNINNEINRSSKLKNKMTAWQTSQWNKAGSPIDVESLEHFANLKKR